MPRRHARHDQRGQMLLVVALMSVLLVGSAALAVDLSVNTQSRRTLQNITDAAALAGAHQLGANQTQAIDDALDALQRNSPWSANATWLANTEAAVACSSGRCSVTAAGPAGFTNYSVSLSSPPATPTNSAYNTSSYLEVDVTQSSANGFGKVIGFGTSSEKGHSISYNSGSIGPFVYAFFARKQAGSGNQVETVIGNAYLGAGYSPQSRGKSAFCALQLTGTEASSDTDGDGGAGVDNDQDEQGMVTFSAAPPTVGPLPTYGTPTPGTPTTTCSAGGGQLDVQAATPSTASWCPPGATPTSSGGSWYCVQASPTVPTIPKPITTQSDVCGGGATGTVTSATTAGVYPVNANCAVTIDFSSGNIDCVSLVLGSGASITVANKKGNVYMSSYGFDPTTDATAKNAITNLPATAPTKACAGSGTNQDRSVIWATDPGAPSSGIYPTVLSNGSTGCCSDTLFVGNIFVPNQQISFRTNQAMEDVGAVYCGDWQVQSGNHPNPVVTYDSNASAFLQQQLKLVE